jgi:ATP-binding cassette subfamily C (CFTR/MRP) protein 1
MIRIQDLTLQNPQSSKPVLQDISYEVDQGSIVMWSGPVGVGKTYLVQAILGEVPPFKGTIAVATKHIGFCSQSPWLPSGSIRKVVLGQENETQIDAGGFDERWYRTVLHACGLGPDLQAMPEGDQT